MDIRQALENIRHITPRLAREEIELIRLHQDEAVPVLLEYIKEIPEDDDDDAYEDGSDDAIFYAMYLLAECRVKQAFPHLARLLTFDEDYTDYLLGDTLTEDFGSILASVTLPGDIPQIQAIVEDEDLGLFQRLAALDAMRVLFVEGAYSRDSYATYLRHLLETYQADPEFLAHVITACERICEQSLLPLIESLYEADLVDEYVTGIDEVRDGMLSGEPEAVLLQKLKESRYNCYINDTIGLLESWAYFSTRPDYGRKVGRNEPCPCGSGKKYKKCCLLKPS